MLGRLFPKNILIGGTVPIVVKIEDKMRNVCSRGSTHRNVINPLGGGTFDEFHIASRFGGDVNIEAIVSTIATHRVIQGVGTTVVMDPPRIGVTLSLNINPGIAMPIPFIRFKSLMSIFIIIIFLLTTFRICNFFGIILLYKFNLI